MNKSDIFNIPLAIIFLPVILLGMLYYMVSHYFVAGIKTSEILQQRVIDMFYGGVK